jgi:hypothetical protein
MDAAKNVTCIALRITGRAIRIGRTILKATGHM